MASKHLRAESVDGREVLSFLTSLQVKLMHHECMSRCDSYAMFRPGAGPWHGTTHNPLSLDASTFTRAFAFRHFDLVLKLEHRYTLALQIAD